jgi:hypothetical protein
MPEVLNDATKQGSDTRVTEVLARRQRPQLLLGCAQVLRLALFQEVIHCGGFAGGFAGGAARAFGAASASFESDPLPPDVKSSSSPGTPARPRRAPAGGSSTRLRGISRGKNKKNIVLFGKNISISCRIKKIENIFKNVNVWKLCTLRLE